MTINDISEIKKQIIKYGKKLGEKNMSPATSGNISVRTEDNIVITGSGTCLADLCEEDMVVIDKNATKSLFARFKKKKTLNLENFLGETGL